MYVSLHQVRLEVITRNKRTGGTFVGTNGAGAGGRPTSGATQRQGRPKAAALGGGKAVLRQ